ncbi:MAG: deoxyribodipyrimidine photo-lyase [Planctomycetes bacterium]|nr:deoxyribodipyrimidine photo-lyase [Planctomycetota bacterium]
MTPAPPVCVWLKRDLRVADHAALAEAVGRSRGGSVFAPFTFEPEVLAQPEWDSSHTEFQGWRWCALTHLRQPADQVPLRGRHRLGHVVHLALDARRLVHLCLHRLGFGPAAPPAWPSSGEALPHQAAALAIPSGTPPGREPLSWSLCARRHEPPDLSPGDPAAPRGLAVPHAVTSGVFSGRRRS